jgi:menaquinone-dependent protoporphyrinogen IX oxidase
LIEYEKKKGNAKGYEVISYVLTIFTFLFLFNSLAEGAKMNRIAIIIGTDLDRKLLDSQKIDALSGATKKEGKVTRTTTTTQIAVRMKEILSNSHIHVDLMPATEELIDFSLYDLVIIGTGIYGRQPHPDVINFVNLNNGILNNKKVAVFAVSGTLGTENVAKREMAREEYSKRISEGLNPIKTALFAGVFPDSGVFWNWIGGLALGGVKPGDHRNWEEIQKWTLSLIE